MATKVFDSLALSLADGSLVLSTANFYAHLVTSEPSSVTANVSGLALVTGGNYSPVSLAGKQITAIANGGAKMTFTNPVWSLLYAGSADPIVGVVICQRAGASPAGTDIPRTFLQLQSSYIPPTNAGGGRDFTFEFSSEGALAITRG